MNPTTSRQDDDGTPHFTYFDYDTQLSFVWDGKSDHIQVAHGGYGEPVSDTIPLSLPTNDTMTNGKAWLLWFMIHCRLYLERKEEKEEEEW